MKRGTERPAYHSAHSKKVTALKLIFAKIPFGEGSNLQEDEFEHPTLLQQVLKPAPLSSFQLFHLLANPAQDGPAIVQPIARTNFKYQFIYNLLYPKHFFR